MDIFKKINALLDNTLDLNSLAAAVNSVTNVQSTDVQSASSYPKSKWCPVYRFEKPFFYAIYEIS